MKGAAALNTAWKKEIEMVNSLPFTLLYEQVAEKIAVQIHQGVLKQGQKVPSVRRFSRQWEVSVSTVIKAYWLLENRGLLESRPQSGFYVCSKIPSKPQEPVMRDPDAFAATVGVSRYISEVLSQVSNPANQNLSLTFPDTRLLAVKPIHRALKNAPNRLGTKGFSYNWPPGNESLRFQISRRYLDCGVNLPPDQIMTTAGCMEALQLCLRAVAREGDTIAIESPTFHGLLLAVETLRMKTLEIPVHSKDGLNLDALKQALRRHKIKACLTVTNYNNPMGCLMSDGNKRLLVEMLRDKGIPLIESDVYGDLHFGEIRPKPAKSFDKDGLVMLCSSFSKSLSPGLRVGWVAPGRWQKAVRGLKTAGSMACNAFTEQSLADFLESGGYTRHLRKARKVYASNLPLLNQAIAKHFPEGVKVSRPAGGFVLWVEFPGRVDAMELYRAAISDKIFITPGHIFSSGLKYKNCVRLSYSNPWSDSIEKALAALGNLAKKQMAGKR